VPQPQQVVQVASSEVEPARPSPEAPPDPISADPEDYKPFLQSAFDSQRADPGWARNAEAKLSQALSGVMEPKLIRNVSCRESLCRVDLSTSDHSSYSSAKMAILTLMWPAQFFLTPENAEQGNYNLVGFFAKEGVPLPDE
jgi:hypothetical protein